MIAIIDAARPGAFVDVVTVATCKLLAYLVVLFAILRVHEPESSIRHLLALRRPPAALVISRRARRLRALAGGHVARRRLLEAVPAVASGARGLRAHLRRARRPARRSRCSSPSWSSCPCCDELFFRGALFTPLKRGRRAESVILATAAYDTLLGGASAREIASILVTALAISWMRAVSGSVFPSVAARVAFFGVQVVPLVLAREPKVTGTVALVGVAVAAVSLAGIAAVGKRSARARDARVADG